VTPPRSEERGRIALIPELDHGEPQLTAEYDIPVDVNDAVVSYIRFFQSRQVRPHFVKWLGRSHRYLDRYRQILREEGLPEDTVYLAMIESGFANFAQSRAKAVGPWQFIASTGKTFGLRQDFWVDERRDPEKSARAAAHYLKELKEQTGDWRLAWAGYNAGAGTIFRAKAKGYQDFWAMAETKGRKILRAETKGYVPKLMAAAIVSKHPEAFGFMPEEIEPERWTDYVEVKVEDAAPLAAVARAAGVPEQVLVDLNPELRRAATPPRPYQLKLPREAGPVFLAAWPELAPKVRTTFDGHVVQRGETLSGIAARYSVPVQGILEMNPRVNPKALRPGTEIIIPDASGRAPASASAKAAAPAAIVAARPATWKVRPGDTLSSIAREHGLALKELCRLNGIDDPDHHKLKVGAQLVLVPQRG
jgi:membrane-bound lytic murein transglycosylase D